MKKLLSLTVILVLLASCTELTNPAAEPGELYPVKFISTLKFDTEESSLKTLKAKGDPWNSSYPSDSIPNDSVYIPKDSLYYRYIVYEMTGKPVKELNGRGNEINDMLPLGDYYISIIGSDKPDLISMTCEFLPKNYYTDVVDYPQAFYSTFSYTVGKPESIVLEQTREVTLERMWGELNVDILDRETCYLPSNVASITLRVEGGSPAFFAQSMKGNYVADLNTVNHRSISDFRNQPLVNCLTSYATEDKAVNVYLDIHFYDKDEIKIVPLSSLVMKKGIRTTLKGNLGNIFEGGYDEGKLKLRLEENWMDEIIMF